MIVYVVDKNLIEVTISSIFNLKKGIKVMSHAVKVVDDDKHFLIDSFTRQVSSEYSKLMITNGDHNSERFTFEAPQNIEGHDMSECNSIEVHYVNINKTKTERVEGIYVVDDLSVEDNKIFFSWLLSRNCTSLIGTLQFSIKFKCLDEDNNIDYEWNTTLFKNVTVLESISNSEAISEKYPDIFEQFKDDVIDEVSNTQKSLVKSVNQNLPDSSGNVEIEISNLPTVSADDAGKFLRVSSTGEWVAESIVNASGVSF